MSCRIAVTCGEPAGIGPDLCIALVQQQQQYELLFIGDPQQLTLRARQLRVPLTLNLLDSAVGGLVSQAGVMNLLPVQFPEAVSAGRLAHKNSAVVLQSIDIAVAGCLNGEFSAMVTCPVHKGVINDAGFTFSGHTEYIAAKSGGYPVMMLACPGLRVALMTTHLPLRRVADAIDGTLIRKVMRILHRELRDRFGIASPEMLVCGLNPHAGEGGHLGAEEQQIIAPALEALRAEGIASHGPLPADTLFTPRYLEHADAVVAMYHDQGLPVLKHMGFGRAVNITLGLPLVRTSVDHGTALDLAGTGRAESGSLIAAIEAAGSMTAHNCAGGVPC
jgi:4-hydroxythreonine-4-phosphate dehydrogenase